MIFLSLFTLGVRDSSGESLKHHTSHLRLKLTYNQDFIIKLTLAFTINIKLSAI
jgi:hypothetical protein